MSKRKRLRWVKQYPILEGKYEGYWVTIVVESNYSKVTARVHDPDVDPKGRGWRERCETYSDRLSNTTDGPGSALGKYLRSVGADIRAGRALRRF